MHLYTRAQNYANNKWREWILICPDGVVESLGCQSRKCVYFYRESVSATEFLIVPEKGAVLIYSTIPPITRAANMNNDVAN